MARTTSSARSLSKSLEFLLGSLRQPGTVSKCALLAVGTLGAVDFVSYQIYEKERKRLSRITESMQPAQREILKSNLGLLVTDNVHSFEQFKQADDENATSLNLRQMLDGCVDWESPRLCLRNIMESQLSTIANYWDTMRREPFVVRDKYFVYRLLARDRQACDADAESDAHTDADIVFRDLCVEDVEALTALQTMSDTHWSAIAASERACVGALDAQGTLLGCSYVDIADLSASQVVHPQHAQALSEAGKRKLAELAADRHFEQGYDRLNARVDVDDEAAMRMRQQMGFERLPQTYYCIEPWTVTVK